MAFEYPYAGFHFSVIFELLPQFPNDMRFQQVSGLTASTQFEAWTEGGENRFVHQLPERLSFSDLVLKRGKFVGSGLLHWVRQATENFEFKPTNVLVSLLDEKHIPICNWYVVNAVPKSIEVSGFDASQSGLLVETLTLSYQYFKYYDPASLVLDASAAISGSISL
jgi:phage tail-like protein